MLSYFLSLHVKNNHTYIIIHRGRQIHHKTLNKLYIRYQMQGK